MKISSLPETRGLFITGTDTGVGKSCATAALLYAFAGQGLQVAGMKPVASGCQVSTGGQLQNEDALLLMKYASVYSPYEQINPYALREPLSPHIAAQHDGVTIAPEIIHGAFDTLRKQADLVLVEGVGGWQVPVSDTLTTEDLAAGLNLPVILVVGMRLGCLNHALLTEQAIRHRGLHIAGWIANHIDPDMLARDENTRTLKSRLDAPLLGEMPFMKKPDIPALAEQIDIGLLNY